MNDPLWVRVDGATLDAIPPSAILVMAVVRSREEALALLSALARGTDDQPE